VRPHLTILLAWVLAGCAGTPERPPPTRATYDQDQTRQDIDRMISEHGDPDGRLARLRDQLPSVPTTAQRPRQDVLLLKPGSGPRPVAPPVHAEQGSR
jgi:outer membrane biogenesis lipoprotein LolB